VTIDAGRIVAIDLDENTGGSSEDPGVEILAPAFVDLQVNGVDDVDVWATAAAGDDAAWDRMNESLIARGVGTWCPTLVTASTDDYRAAVEFISGRMLRDGVPRIAGTHLEGPFLGSATGAHRRDLVTAPDMTLFDGLATLPSIVTLGAEHALAPSIIRELVARGVTVSIGHTRPDRRGYEEAVESGARMVTHLHNAMSGMAHREPGLATWA